MNTSNSALEMMTLLRVCCHFTSQR